MKDDKIIEIKGKKYIKDDILFCDYSCRGPENRLFLDYIDKGKKFEIIEIYNDKQELKRDYRKVSKILKEHDKYMDFYREVMFQTEANERFKNIDKRKYEFTFDKYILQKLSSDEIKTYMIFCLLKKDITNYKVRSLGMDWKTYKICIESLVKKGYLVRKNND